jgi:hypothetical protein
MVSQLHSIVLNAFSYSPEKELSLKMPPSKTAKADLAAILQRSEAEHTSTGCHRSVENGLQHRIAVAKSALLKSSVAPKMTLPLTKLSERVPPKQGHQDESTIEALEPANTLEPTAPGTGEGKAAAGLPLSKTPSQQGKEQLEERNPKNEEQHPIILPPPSQDSKITTNWEDFFELMPSGLGGLGAFAVRELKIGETILVEAPLLRTTHFRLMLDYRELSETAKKTYLSLHGGEDADAFSRVERIKQLNS